MTDTTLRHNYPTSTDEAAHWTDPCDSHLLNVECDEQDDEFTPNGRFHVHCFRQYAREHNARGIRSKRTGASDRYFSRPQA